ncbi:MAG: hypothetical protein N2745_05050 [Syntrophorhabdaceae bacterium]|nr:hypothetical protein [Syntrophorhabdaceae bacterium]
MDFELSFYMETNATINYLMNILGNSIHYPGEGRGGNTEGDGFNFSSIFEGFLSLHGGVDEGTAEEGIDAKGQAFLNLALPLLLEKYEGQSEEKKEIEVEDSSLSLMDKPIESQKLAQFFMYLSNLYYSEQMSRGEDGKIKGNSVLTEFIAPDTKRGESSESSPLIVGAEKKGVFQEKKDIREEERPQGYRVNQEVEKPLYDKNIAFQTPGLIPGYKIEELMDNPRIEDNQEERAYTTSIKGNMEEKVHLSSIYGVNPFGADEGDDRPISINPFVLKDVTDGKRDTFYVGTNTEMIKHDFSNKRILSKGEGDEVPLEKAKGYRLLEREEIEVKVLNLSADRIEPAEKDRLFLGELIKKDNERASHNIPYEMDEPMKMAKVKERLDATYLTEKHNDGGIISGLKADENLGFEKIREKENGPKMEYYMGQNHSERLNNIGDTGDKAEGVLKSHFNLVDRVEKIIEEAVNKNESLNVVVRLKFNEDDTILLGFKQEGKSIIVDIKTMDARITNILQTNRDTIIRNLEDKNIYANIFINPDGTREGNGKREYRYTGRRNYGEGKEGKGFKEILEAI